jgi:ABC-type glycerol-3-phosphate transport system permease component
MSTLVKKRLTGKKIGRGTRNLLTVLFAVVYLIPLYVAVVNSFKTYWEVIKSPLALPSSPTLENFTEAFHASNILSLYGTSILITFTSVTLLVLISSTAAYIIIRRKNRLSSQTWPAVSVSKPAMVKCDSQSPASGTRARSTESSTQTRILRMNGFPPEIQKLLEL